MVLPRRIELHQTRVRNGLLPSSRSIVTFDGCVSPPEPVRRSVLMSAVSASLVVHRVWGFVCSVARSRDRELDQPGVLYNYPIRSGLLLLVREDCWSCSDTPRVERCAVVWCGGWESNPRLRFGRPRCCRNTSPAIRADGRDRTDFRRSGTRSGFQNTPAERSPTSTRSLTRGSP